MSAESDKLRCCNPFLLHSENAVITGDLRAITLKDKEKHSNIPAVRVGEFWCKRCRITPSENEPSAAAVPSGSQRKSIYKRERDLITSTASTTDGPFCCDPYKLHPTKKIFNVRTIIKSNLRDFADLKVGDHWCDSCRLFKNYSGRKRAGSPTADQLEKEVGRKETWQRVRDDETSPTEVCSETLSLQSKQVEIRENQQEVVIGDEGSLSVVLSMSPDICHIPPSDTIENQYCIFKNDTYLCKANLRIIKGLNTDELYALSWTSGMWEINSNHFICDGHYFQFIGKYKEGEQADLESCCDPYRKHFKKVDMNLRTVSLALVLQSNAKDMKLTYGSKICKNCINDLRISPEDSNEKSYESSSSSSILTPSIQKASVDMTLKTLGISPLQNETRSEIGRIAYGERKLYEVIEVAQKKISQSLSLPLERIEPVEFKKARYHDKLMEEVKTKLVNATKKEKYQLISLLPSELTPSEASKEFKISRTLFEAVQEVKSQSGILPDIVFKRRSTVLDLTKELIVKFYNDDENSRQLAGKDDNIRISKSEVKQRRILLCSHKELYELFQKSYPNIKVSFSVFYKLKPKWCVYPGGPGTQNVCVCQYHENLRLIISALDITLSYRDIIKALVCSEESRECMLRLCTKCPTISQICHHLESLTSRDGKDEEEFMEETIEFNQWKGTDRTELITQVCSRSELLQKAGEQFHTVIPHHYIAKQQAIYIKQAKQDLTPKKVIINLDFAMNFGCLFVNEVQSYHWGKTQVTLHMGVIYYKEETSHDAADLLNENDETRDKVKYHNICMISDDLKHDVSLVKVCVNKIIAIVKENHPQIEEVEYLTDGCGQQYKNKVHFYNLCHHREEFGLKASHAFFATSHGKSQCDAMAGITKRILTSGSLQRVNRDQINSARKAFNFLSGHELSKKIQFVFVDKAEVELERDRICGLDPKKTMTAVPGTRSFHHFVPISETSVGCKRLSVDQEIGLVHTIRQVDVQNFNHEFSTGAFVVVKINRTCFAAQITDVSVEDGEAEVTMLAPKLPTDLFKWPEDLNTLFVPLPHVVCVVQLRETDAGFYTLTEEDKNLLILKKVLKKKN